MHRTRRSRRSRIDSPSYTTSDPSSTNSTVPSSPYHRWELSTLPLHLIIYSNREGLESDMPRTRLPVHKPKTACALFRSLGNVFDLLRYKARPCVHRVLNRITISYYTYSSVTACLGRGSEISGNEFDGSDFFLVNHSASCRNQRNPGGTRSCRRCITPIASLPNRRYGQQVGLSVRPLSEWSIRTASKNPACGVKRLELKSGANWPATFRFATSKLDLLQEC